MNFSATEYGDIEIAGSKVLESHNVMSPYVWQDAENGLHALVRSRPKDCGDEDITGQIWYASVSANGLLFRFSDDPVITPGSCDEDVGGCEDPTVVFQPDGTVIVYYTGVSADGKASLLYAAGQDVFNLKKRGTAIVAPSTEHGTKEAALKPLSNGKCHMLYEYSRDGHSCIGIAVGRQPDGPWDEREDPFNSRQGHWDSWHLSTGPLMTGEANRPFMFYNGANKDAKWQIGWIVFNEDLSKAVARSTEPLVSAPEGSVHSRDMSFAASAIYPGVSTDTIWLYYSCDDYMLRRATIMADWTD